MDVTETPGKYSNIISTINTVNIKKIGARRTGKTTPRKGKTEGEGRENDDDESSAAWYNAQHTGSPAWYNKK